MESFFFIVILFFIDCFISVFHLFNCVHLYLSIHCLIHLLIDLIIRLLRNWLTELLKQSYLDSEVYP